MALYLNFYGFDRDPFGVTPDPDCLFMTPGHKEALAQLLYAIQEKTGFILVTAEVGLGKTTLLEALRQELDSNTAVAYVSNSLLPFPAILEYMLEEFGIEKPGESAAQRLVVLQNFLVERHGAGQNTVLILDEAQNLYPQTLEQIRLLSNFETTKEKILQIVLVGQPELLARLEMPELRQLKQRISIMCTIPPMTRSGTRNYIRTRLRMAGARDLGIFTDPTVGHIVRSRNGIPRRGNPVGPHPDPPRTKSSKPLGQAHRPRATRLQPPAPPTPPVPHVPAAPPVPQAPPPPPIPLTPPPAAPSAPSAGPASQPAPARRRATGPRRSATVTGDVENHLVSLVSPSGLQAEQYRALRHA